MEFRRVLVRSHPEESGPAAGQGLPCYSVCIATHPVRSRGMIPGGKKLSHRIPILPDVRDRLKDGGAPPFSSADHAQRISRSEEHTSELQSLMRISYAVFCLKKKNNTKHQTHYHQY